MRNVFTIDTDIKLKMLINEPVVVQNDAIRFIINVFDNGQSLDLANVETVSLANVRLDGKTVVTHGSKIGTNTVQFDLGTEETKVPGRVEATAQFYDSEGRVSTISFSYRVVKDPTGSGYVPSDREQTLIEVVLNNGPLVIQQAQDAVNAASEAAANANEAATSANNAAASANAAADNANLAAERANNEADYAKLQGDYAKAQAELIDDVLDQGPVVAVNGKTGNVILTAEDINAIPTSDFTQFQQTVTSHLAEKVTLASYQPIKKVRYIAHRGMSAIAPENTIPAYELAGELGMWGAECDVTTTKDGALVLMHDATVDRMTDGTGYVSDFTLDEIKNLKIDAGNNFELYPNLRVPTLEEYLITCKKYGLVPVIEIKPTIKYSGYDTFVNLIKKYGYEENCIVISISLTVLQEVRLRSKKIVMQYLADISETTINQVRELGNAGLDVNYTSLTKEKIELAHSNGLMVNAWTVNNPQIAKNLTDFCVDYITTDILVEVI